MSTNEEWKPIPGSAGYEASTEGRIRNSKGLILKCQKHHAGYRLISVQRPDRTTWQSTVHFFVALAFHGPRPDGMEVAHGDHDKTNNRPSNLRYATKLENMNDGHPRLSNYFRPWNQIEIGETFVTNTWWKGVMDTARNAGRIYNKAFLVERIPGGVNRTLVTRVPMLDAMTCSATANVRADL